MKENERMSKTKRSTTRGGRRRAIQTLTPRDALQLLASALAYCQQAGLNVNALNREDDTLALFIPHARYRVTADGGAALEFAPSAEQ